MKKVAIYVVIIVAVMTSHVVAPAKDWAANWFELSESEKNVLVAGYRLGAEFVCNVDKDSNKSTLLCAISKSSLDKYVEVPGIVDVVYKKEKYRSISIDWLIYTSLLYINKNVDEKKFFSILDGFAKIEDNNSDNNAQYKLNNYESMVKGLLQ
jgi:hypothetical protein